MRSIVGRFLEHTRVFYFHERRRSRSCTAPAPTGWSATSSAASRSASRSSARSSRAHPARSRDSTSATTRRPGSCRPTARYERACTRAERAQSSAQATSARDAIAAAGTDRRQWRDVEHPQPEADRASQVFDFVLEVGARQRVLASSQPRGNSHRRATAPRGSTVDRSAVASALRPRCSSTARRSSSDQLQRLACPTAEAARRCPPATILRRWPPTSAASSIWSSREKPGMSAFSSR